MSKIKVGLVQQSVSADVLANRERLASNIRDCATQGANLVVLQELHNTPYFCQTECVDNFDLAEPIPGPSTEFYGALAKELNIVLVTSLFERRSAGLYHNTAVVFDTDGSMAGKYFCFTFFQNLKFLLFLVHLSLFWAAFPLSQILIPVNSQT